MYKAGFATKQEQYSLHASGVFVGFQKVEDILGGSTGQRGVKEYLAEAVKVNSPRQRSGKPLKL